jgi:hypothetical protein
MFLEKQTDADDDPDKNTSTAAPVYRQESVDTTTGKQQQQHGLI